MNILLVLLGVKPRLPSKFAQINTARRAENFFGYRAEFESRILGRISDFYEHCQQAE